ncbi:hypothetical protein [Novosphingobium sp. ST904]|uniref:hypothetical protein n=1 Tax=Novosphingobium sp. ST904 TaxID=1684385 RepID=UPI0010E59430|nr:hypothetical protein [Novosphingobium sp. ST904]TCM25698.1 hypothetical protein EDF59_13910 [Novosphingobium sp. ST904]
MADPIIPFDYYDRLKRRGAGQTADPDPISDTLTSMRANSARRSILESGAPDDVARVERVARAAGENPSAVEGNIDLYERSLNASRFTATATQYPAVAAWAMANPRGAAMAADDSKSLGALGTAWDFVSNIPGRLWHRGLPLVAGGLTKTWNTIQDAQDSLFSPIDAAVDAVDRAFDISWIDVERTRKDLRRQRVGVASYWDAKAEAGGQTARGGNSISEGLLQGIDSLPLTAIALLTRNPTIGATTIGTQVAGTSYQDAIAKGVSPDRAARLALAQGGTEVLTERIPMGTLLEMTTRKLPWGKAFIRELGQEMTGEQVATFFQDMADWSYLPENSNKTFGDFLAERPEAAAQTALATLGGTGTTSVAIGAAHRATDATLSVGQRLHDRNQAKREKSFLEQAARATTESKLKQRDPESFRTLVRAQAQEAGATAVFIPGEAIRAYNQSDHYDPDADPLAQTDAAEAAATGGDVVMPIEDFLTDVVGTPAWDAIKDDVRLSQGGMSTREAQTFDEAMEDILGHAADELARSDREGRAARTARDQLVDRLAGMFGESFTAPVARQYAEIAVQRAQTRAQRLGMELTPDDLNDLSIRQILPEGVAEAVSADRLDLVINAMRAGGSVDYGVGPSLLEFIRQRGGMNDTGGDLASMGVPSRYLTGYDVRQAELTGGLSGMGDFGIDNTLRAAIEAGYFPDLANVENEQGPSTLDTQRLLDAIREELSGGTALYPETRTDEFRALAEDLRQTLEEAGYAPSNMTDEEVRDAVDRMSRPAEGGQAYEQSARGRTVFEQNRRIIELFQGRDLSTPIHELGHVWLEELMADAALENAPDQLRSDWEAVRSWFAHSGHAVSEDGTIPVEAHELFARGIERYFMEGKAPTTALTRIFENVRQWMLSIYKSVASLRSDITPEIREVFDRMIASDEEISAARDRQGIENLFKDAAEAGMSQAEFAAYQEKSRDASAAANAKLLERVMSTIRRRETERYRDQRRAVRVEEEERIDNAPLFKAMAAMDMNRGGSRISKEWVVDRLGLDALDMLPRRVPPIYAENGVNPEHIAEMAGYGSASEMLQALIGAERLHREARDNGDKRSMRDRAIETATDAEMNRRYGDPLNDGSIEQEALAAVQSEMLGEVLSSEIRALGRRSGRGPLPYQIARDWARGKVRSGKWIDVASPGALVRHARNAARAAKAAEAALVAGDHAEAYRQKQFQMLNNALAAEAFAAADQVEAVRKRLDEIAEAKTRKAVDQDYLEQAQMLLEAVDLKRRSQIYEKRKGSFSAWAAAREAEGFDVVVPESFTATLGLTNWSQMPIDDIFMLDEAVKQIMHLGRLKQSLVEGNEQREWEALEQEAVDSAANLRGRPPQDLAAPGWWESLRSKIAGIDSSLLKMETVFDWLDGGNSNGVFNRVVFRPIAAAQARETEMVKDYQARIKALFEAVPAEIASRWQDRITLPFTDVETGRPMVLNRQQLVAMALNVGNEGNLQRLADGYRLNGGALVGYLDQTLTQQEWQFVQNVWDEIDTLWPQISEIEKRVNGVAPDKVRARKFVTTSNGQMRGGYYPAVYDSTRNYKAQENAGKERDLLEGGYTRATTRASSTKARDEQVKRPILLDLGVINRHLGEVIHDITHREAVINANRFLSSERVRRAVDGALGQEIGNQLRPWVKFVANSWAVERAGNEGFGKWLGKLRANTTAVGMGLRATTMVTQIAGYSNSMEVVGEAAMSKALAQFARNPASAIRSVMERSDEVRHRMATLDRDLRTEIARISMANPATKAAALVLDGKKFFFHGIGYMDMVVSVPTWMAAYDNAVKAGMSEADAAYAADKAVRQSQGAGGPKDLAAIQRGTGKHGEALKLATMFYSYFSAQYQRQRTLGRDVTGADGRRLRNMPRLAARGFFLLVLPALLTEVLRGAVGAPAGPDEDEWWSQWLIRKLLANSLGPIPIVRDVFEPSWNAARGAGWRGTSITPVQRALESLVGTAGDIGKITRGEETKHATKDILETAGYLTGLVPGQVASATQFLVDVGSGDAEPDGFGDWLQGLSTGKIEE